MNKSALPDNLRKQNSIIRIVVKERKTVVAVISALFILLFVYTAVSKLLEIETFRYVLKESPLIGKYAEGIVWLLPAFELIISALLFIPVTRQRGLYSSFALMVGFTLYLAYMITFTPHLPCQCGGVISKMTWNQHLVFNLFFTMLALAGILLSNKGADIQKTEDTPAYIFT